MKTRLILYYTDRNSECNSVYFFVPPDGFEKSLTDALDTFAEQNRFTRKLDFDWAVGNNGFNCALLEAAEQKENILISKENNISMTGQWCRFPMASKILTEGEDKRYLQLAVQYIAAGGIDDSIIASDYDMEFLETLKKSLMPDGNS